MPEGENLKAVLLLKLLGSNHTWLLAGEPTYIIEDMPYSTYELEMVGINFGEAIYWEEGAISFGKAHEITPDTVLKAGALMATPAVRASAYELVRLLPSLAVTLDNHATLSMSL